MCRLGAAAEHSYRRLRRSRGENSAGTRQFGPRNEGTKTRTNIRGQCLRLCGIFRRWIFITMSLCLQGKTVYVSDAFLCGQKSL